MRQYKLTPITSKTFSHPQRRALREWANAFLQYDGLDGEKMKGNEGARAFIT